MGASVSKNTTTVKELNEQNLAVDNSTYNEIVNTCTSSQKQSNVLQIIGSDVTKLNTDQKNLAKNMCMLSTAIQKNLDSNNDAKMASLLKTQLEANATAGIGVAITDNTTNIEKTNRVNLKVDNRTFNKAMMGCLNDQAQANVIQIVGSRVTDSSLNQANEAIMECVSNYGAVDIIKQGTSTDIKSTTESDSKGASKGYDPLAFLGGLATLWFIIPIICICLSVSSVASTLMGGGGAGGSGFSGSGSFDMASKYGSIGGNFSNSQQ
jgi:hypothetical protein